MWTNFFKSLLDLLEYVSVLCFVFWLQGMRIVKLTGQTYNPCIGR